MKKFISLSLVSCLLSISMFSYVFADSPQETVIIRNGDTIVFQGQVSLPASGTIAIADHSGAIHTVSSQSVLGVLYALDQTNDTFALTDLEFYNSFNSFYLKCLAPAGGTDICDSWQYAVGAVTPATSIDTTPLSGGETIGLYTGMSHRLRLDTNTISAGGTVVANAEHYDYTNNAWVPLTNVNVGVTVPNPNDAWNPTVISTSPVSADGKAPILFSNAGTFTLGIAEDFYYPSYTVTVVPVYASGGGGSRTIVHPIFSTDKALSYLESVQSIDGSFGGSSLYTDWVAIAYGALKVNDHSKENLISYLKTNTTVSKELTDNERHTLAILALGENPYNFADHNYIDAIVKSFDGTQFGDPALINDDIFALIPLSHSGYEVADPVIQKDVTFLVSKQNANGSWENSLDLTAASMQALEPYTTISGVNEAMTRAYTYLQNAQDINGGWNNSAYTTSWVLQAMSLQPTIWSAGDSDGFDYLGSLQSSDGGLLSVDETIQNRIWATSYAIPAILKMSWNTFIPNIAKPTTSTTPTPTPDVVTPIDTTPTVAITPSPIPPITTEVSLPKIIALLPDTIVATPKAPPLAIVKKNIPLSASAVPPSTDNEKNVPSTKAHTNIFKTFVKNITGFVRNFFH